MTQRTRLLFAALPLVLAAGCPKPPPPDNPKAAADADARSGSDATRAGAGALALDAPTTDDVNWAEQDRTDWKRVDVPGKSGVLVVDLRWDNVNADLNCDVYNSFGQQIAGSPYIASEPRKKLLVPIDGAGVYFLRIQAARTNDASVYAIHVHFDAGDKPGEGPRIIPTEPITVKPPETPPETPETPPGETEPREPPPEKSTEEVQGRIVTAYQEGGAWVLQLDKGAAAGIKVGHKGTVLEGPTGSNAFADGEFTITKVVDNNRSIARCKAKKGVGKNRRVVVNVD